MPSPTKRRRIGPSPSRAKNHQVPDGTSSFAITSTTSTMSTSQLNTDLSSRPQLIRAPPNLEFADNTVHIPSPTILCEKNSSIAGARSNPPMTERVRLDPPRRGKDHQSTHASSSSSATPITRTTSASQLGMTAPSCQRPDPTLSSRPARSSDRPDTAHNFPQTIRATSFARPRSAELSLNGRQCFICVLSYNYYFPYSQQRQSFLPFPPKPPR